MYTYTYEHAKKVRNVFRCKNLTEYHNLYNRSDVMILADVFETFRKTYMDCYKLDPCSYYTVPGLSWDAMLKSTNIELRVIERYRYG
jgi:hypothetical protein